MAEEYQEELKEVVDLIENISTHPKLRREDPKVVKGIEDTMKEMSKIFIEQKGWMWPKWDSDINSPILSELMSNLKKKAMQFAL